MCLYRRFVLEHKPLQEYDDAVIKSTSNMIRRCHGRDICEYWCITLICFCTCCSQLASKTPLFVFITSTCAVLSWLKSALSRHSQSKASANFLMHATMYQPCVRICVCANIACQIECMQTLCVVLFEQTSNHKHGCSSVAKCRFLSWWGLTRCSQLRRFFRTVLMFIDSDFAEPATEPTNRYSKNEKSEPDNEILSRSG